MVNLHIANGDGAAELLKASAVPGDVLPWRDPMHHGPFPAGIDLEALSAIRADYLAGDALDLAETRRGFALRDEHLKAAPQYERVVLWFEHDLLDQLQILQLLDWFADADLKGAELEMICIDRFEGVPGFRGLGELTVDQIASLFEKREPVSAAQFALAKAGWAAFRAADPRVLLAFLETDLSALPFLRQALSRHLEEYPSALSGLTRTEQQLLSVVSEGATDPAAAFIANMDLETTLYIGDWRTFAHLGELNRSTPQFLRAEEEPFWFPPQTNKGREAFRRQRLHLTHAGHEVLSGRRSAFDILTRNFWLGGVHVSSEGAMWVWDAEAETLRLRGGA